ncbi:unnamed protein product [Gadus morhua 'NCC']
MLETRQRSRNVNSLILENLDPDTPYRHQGDAIYRTAPEGVTFDGETDRPGSDEFLGSVWVGDVNLPSAAEPGSRDHLWT